MANFIDRIYQQIEAIWVEFGAMPEFIQAMRQPVIALNPGEKPLERVPARWAMLPGLCCQAAGMDSRNADPLAAAWLLYYLAAHIMDSVEDQDEPDLWWVDAGPGYALNVASGLFFSASRALGRTWTNADLTTSQAVYDRFQTSFISMCAGQHQDITQPEPTLEQCWETARGKSGAFFSLACWAGARLAQAPDYRLEAYAQFGLHLGLLIQVLDDLEEFKGHSSATALSKNPGIRRALPVAYTLAVSLPAERDHLLELLERSTSDQAAAVEAAEILDRSGAALYMLMEIDRQRSLALQALELAEPLPPAGDDLRSLVSHLGVPT